MISSIMVTWMPSLAEIVFSTPLRNFILEFWTAIQRIQKRSLR